MKGIVPAGFDILKALTHLYVGVTEDVSMRCQNVNTYIV